MGKRASKDQEERRAATFKLKPSTIERIDAARWALKLSKQDVVEKALEELFKKHGIK